MKPHLNGMPPESHHGNFHHPGFYRTNLHHNSPPFIRVADKEKVGSGERFGSFNSHVLNDKRLHKDFYSNTRDWLKSGNQLNELEEITFIVDNFQKEMKEELIKQIVAFRRHFSTKTRDLEWRVNRLELQNFHLLTLTSKLQCDLNAAYKDATSKHVEPISNEELLPETQTLYDSKVRAAKDCSRLEALRAKIKQRRNGSGVTSKANKEHELGTTEPAGPTLKASQNVLFKSNEDNTDVFSDGPLSPIFEPRQCSRSQLHYGSDSFDDNSNTFQSKSTKKPLELQKTSNEESTEISTAVTERNKIPPHLLPSLIRSPNEKNSNPHLKRNQLSLEDPCETFLKHNLHRRVPPHKKYKPGVDLLSSDENVSSRPLQKEKQYKQQSRLLSADTLAAQDLSEETKETAKETQRRTSLCSPVTVVSGSSPEIIVDDDEDVSDDIESFRRNSLQECLRRKFLTHHPVSFRRLTQRSAEEERERTDFWSNQNSSMHALAGTEHLHNFQTLQNGTFESKDEEIYPDRNTGFTESILNEQENVSRDTKSFSLSEAHVQMSPSDGKHTVSTFDSEVTKSKNVQFCGARGKYKASSGKKTGAVRKYCTVRNPAPNSLIYKLVAQLNDAYSRVPTQSEANLTSRQLNNTSVDELQASDLDQRASSVDSLDCTKHNNQNPEMKQDSQNKDEAIKDISMTSSVEASNQNTAAFTPSSPTTSSSVQSCDHNKTKSMLYSSHQAVTELITKEIVNTSPGENKESQQEKKTTTNSETYLKEKKLFILGKEEKVLELKTKKSNSPSEEMDSLTSESKKNQKSFSSTSTCFNSIISATAPCACSPADTAEIGSSTEKNRETEYEILTVKSDSEMEEQERKHGQVFDSENMDKKDLPSITVHFQPESLPPLLVSNDDALTGLPIRQDLLRKKMKSYQLPKYLMKSIRKRASHSFVREHPLQNNCK